MKRKTLWILFLLLLIGFALRLNAFDHKSLWLDEIYTFQDSRDGFQGQLKYYEEKPTYLHPPGFYMLTHLFYPFPRPERDLRIFPLIFGTLSIPMIFLLARLFSSGIAVPCALALTFMTYHIALSQEARSYSLILFLAMGSLYFLMKHVITAKKRFLFPAALLFAIMFHVSYTSIPLIALSQLLWFYRPPEQQKKPRVTSFLLLNALILILCSPWILFLFSHYNGQPLINPVDLEDPGSFVFIVYGVFHDWLPHWPVQLIAILLQLALIVFLRNRRNAVVLVALFILPIAGLYVACKVFPVGHFVSSRYFITFLPLFFISLFLSLEGLEIKFERVRKVLRFKLVFLTFFVASNLVILPLYYQSEKQDNRGLVNYLKANVRDGDRVFLQKIVFFPGVLHYAGIATDSRYYRLNFLGDREQPTDYSKTVAYQGKTFTFHSSKTCCSQYVSDGHRLWIVVHKEYAEELKKNSPAVLKGYFDGSFLNFNRFPADVSFYLFLWDPSSPNEKGIDLSTEQ